MKLFFLFLTLLSAGQVFAYPNFVGFGYNACLTCHYNPFGNGPLTDYGRALSATAISDRQFRAGATSEEELGKNSGFLYSSPSQQWFRPSANYRGLYLKSNYQDSTEKSQTIHMDANLNAVLRLGPDSQRDKFIVVGSFGYAPDPLSNPNSTQSNWRSREHYLGLRLGERWGIYAGMMDKIYGLRIPDHIAYSRQSTATTMNDQTHGLALHYTVPTFEFGLHGFAGNLGQGSSIRQQGGSFSLEYSITDATRLGHSQLFSKSEFLESYAAALHTRTRFGKGSSVMMEAGLVKKTQVKRQVEIASHYGLLQNHILLSRGFYLVNTLEYLRPTTKKENKNLRLGPGLQYFVSQGVEFRLDIYNERIFSDRSVSDDVWDLTGQLHLWF